MNKNTAINFWGLSTSMATLLFLQIIIKLVISMFKIT
nr:MAG TPA: hypothetical protein [Caudoviricetes sp.]